MQATIEKSSGIRENVSNKQQAVLSPIQFCARHTTVYILYSQVDALKCRETSKGHRIIPTQNGHQQYQNSACDSWSSPCDTNDQVSSSLDVDVAGAVSLGYIFSSLLFLLLSLWREENWRITKTRRQNAGVLHSWVKVILFSLSMWG